jgi:hypothetical protein
LELVKGDFRLGEAQFFALINKNGTWETDKHGDQKFAEAFDIRL